MYETVSTKPIYISISNLVNRNQKLFSLAIINFVNKSIFSCTLFRSRSLFTSEALSLVDKVKELNS